MRDHNQTMKHRHRASTRRWYAACIPPLPMSVSLPTKVYVSSPRHLRVRLARVLTGVALLGASHCNVAGHASSAPGTNGSSARVEGAHPAGDELKLAKLTPQLIDHSERLFEQHADRPVGTEVPFTLHGRRYVGRIEMHNDPAKGEHKGLTVYIPHNQPQRLGSANQE